ncbi:MAG: regulatory protein RecX [Ectothiorhodospiraceae bacterium]|jgi:regulatory protein|nr:regulatory protein RecX [Ectothiorhodospiraceae bacterium]
MWRRSKPDADPYAAALRLLARREHSRRELERKLSGRCERQDLAQVLDGLEQEGLLSDRRFSESFVRWRADQGHGPVRIREELRERGVADELAGAALDEWDEHWPRLAREVYRKRYGEDLPPDHQERARRARFLQYRGFPASVVRRVVDGIDEEG